MTEEIHLPSHENLPVTVGAAACPGPGDQHTHAPPSTMHASMSLSSRRAQRHRVLLNASRERGLSGRGWAPPCLTPQAAHEGTWEQGEEGQKNSLPPIRQTHIGFRPVSCPTNRRCDFSRPGDRGRGWKGTKSACADYCRRVKRLNRSLRLRGFA